MTISPLPLADVELIEQAEGEYLRRFLDGASPSARAELGIRTRRFGGGMAAAMLHDPSGYWTKSLGLGFDSPLTADLLREVTSFFGESGKDTALLAVAPQVLPSDWDTLREELGLTAASTWSKLACPVTDLIPGSTDLDVRELTAEDVPSWSRIIREAFGMTEPDLTPMLRGVIDDPDARAFGAWDGDLLVGAGAVHVVGEVASITTGGTLASHRGRGVQSALLAARGAAARDAGCRLLTAETGAGGDNPSFRNLVRSGFTHHYDRINWRWTV